MIYLSFIYFFLYLCVFLLFVYIFFKIIYQKTNINSLQTGNRIGLYFKRIKSYLKFLNLDKVGKKKKYYTSNLLSQIDIENSDDLFLSFKEIEDGHGHGPIEIEFLETPTTTKISSTNLYFLEDIFHASVDISQQKDDLFNLLVALCGFLIVESDLCKLERKKLSSETIRELVLLIEFYNNLVINILNIFNNKNLIIKKLIKDVSKMIKQYTKPEFHQHLYSLLLSKIKKYENYQPPMPLINRGDINIVDSSPIADINDLISQNDPKSIFSVHPNIVLGKGGFAKVFLGNLIVDVDSFLKSSQIAVKVMNYSFNRKLNIELEVSNMKSCNHPNIVKYIDSFLEESNENLTILMEFMDNGSISELISKGVQIPESHISYLAKQILNGIQYLHSKNIVHRDIKSSNILLNSFGVAKISDFGISKKISKNNENFYDVSGTPLYLAPEIFINKKYSKPADIWSFGIMILEMANGSVPNCKEPILKTLFLHSIEPPKLSCGNWSEEFQDFSKSCLEINDLTRSTADMLLMHPFLDKSCNTLEFLSFNKNSLKVYSPRGKT